MVKSSPQQLSPSPLSQLLLTVQDKYSIWSVQSDQPLMFRLWLGAPIDAPNSIRRNLKQVTGLAFATSLPASIPALQGMGRLSTVDMALQPALEPSAHYKCACFHKGRNTPSNHIMPLLERRQVSGVGSNILNPRNDAYIYIYIILMVTRRTYLTLASNFIQHSTFYMCFIGTSNLDGNTKRSCCLESSVWSVIS